MHVYFNFEVPTVPVEPIHGKEEKRNREVVEILVFLPIDQLFVFKHFTDM